jgi:hypothetical protein
MAKSKPIGVRFDLGQLDFILTNNPKLKTPQSVLNFLMTFYESIMVMNDNFEIKPINDLTVKEMAKNHFDSIIKRGAPFKNMPPYDRNSPKSVVSSKLEQIPVENNKTPPKGLKGIDLVIWKSENGI